MRKFVAGVVLALSMGVSSPAVAQSGGYVDLSFFLQNLFFTNTGTTTLTKLQYSHGPIAAGSAVFDLNGNNGAAGGTASDFVSANRFMTVTWSGLSVGAGSTATFGNVDNDLISSLAPLTFDEGTLTGGLEDSFIRAWFSNGDVLTGSLTDGAWTPTQRVQLASSVPEPSSVWLLSVGLTGIAALRRRRRTD